MTRIAYVLLGVFLLLYGLATVTNLRFDWMSSLTGFAALVAGVLVLLAAYLNRPLP